MATFTPTRASAFWTARARATGFGVSPVAISVLILRRTEPTRHRPFRTPVVVLVAPLTILGCAVLYWRLPFDARMVLPIWGGIGLVLYFLYGYWNSHVARGAGGQVSERD